MMIERENTVELSLLINDDDDDREAMSERQS
jgi:hypothetical protein